MGLNKNMIDLLDNVKRTMIFYIPSSLFENLQKKHIDELESFGFLNTLFYMDTQGDPKSIKDSIEYIRLLSKDKILKSNVFELLDMKTRLDKNAFHYIIDDYFKELEAQVFLTEAIKKEAKETAINYVPQIQAYLELQYKQLIEHQEELKQKFGSWKSRFEIERIFGGFKTTSPNIKLDKKVLEIPNADSKSDRTKVRKSVKKERLKINEAEVDRYILETTFGVDFSKIDSSKISD